VAARPISATAPGGRHSDRAIGRGQGVEIRVFGPVELYAGGQAVGAGPPQARILLAALAVEPGRAVTTEALIERVWDDPPEGARRTLHVLITHLRRRLAEAAAADRPDAPQVRLERRSGAYVLAAVEAQVDLFRFRELVAGAAREPAPLPRREALRAALALWRGAPLAGLPGRWADRARAAWAREHRDAVLAWARSELPAPGVDGPDLPAGDLAGAIAALTDLLGEDPLAETAAAVLMLALHAAGRTAEALDRYRRTAAELADELGLDPGAELRQAHLAILRGPAAAPTTPAEPAAVPAPRRPVPEQLPADVYGFTGRAPELDALDRLLDPPAGGAAAVLTAMVISAISGTAGVGKTALAVHWAHQVRDRFPDGRLYLNLRGYDPKPPLTAADALAALLTGLGVTGHEIPVDAEARAARYRTELAGRRMLVLLDNASSVGQVRPLLPGDAATVVVITSRDPLSGLVAVNGARRLDLDVLPPDEAVAALRALIGARVDAEPAAAAELARRCARLPLALRVAAELAGSRAGEPLADVVADLADQSRRLDLLDAGGDDRADVRAVFSWSYRSLPPDAARLFRLAGLNPAPDLGSYAAAALTDSTLAVARRDLELLRRSQLLQPAPGRLGRYAMHDLLRDYARGLAEGTDPEADRDAALARLFGYYIGTAAAAMDVLHPADAARRPPIEATRTPMPALTTPEQGRAWLDAEVPALLAMAGHGAAHGCTRSTYLLDVILYRYFDGRRHVDAVTMHQHALAAGRAAGDEATQAQAYLGLGSVDWQLGRLPGAGRNYERALHFYRGCGDLLGQARTLDNLGGILRDTGDLAGAAAHNEQARELFARVGDRSGEARALTNLGTIRLLRGEHLPAIDSLEVALAVYEHLTDRGGEAYALDSLGLAEYAAGRFDKANVHHARALRIYSDLGIDQGEFSARLNMGESMLVLNQPARALEVLEAALPQGQRMGLDAPVAQAHNGLGKALQALGRPEEAVRHHTRALAGADRIGDAGQVAAAHAGLARAYAALGEPRLAREHERRAGAVPRV
jgi:DNA-binding SARP family transcriptional activator/tetratricopeptide (TPR) repeat protein